MKQMCWEVRETGVLGGGDGRYVEAGVLGGGQGRCVRRWRQGRCVR